jgi:very-short-patch-repair endonuclease
MKEKEEKECKICGKLTTNKVYCSKECRYKDSFFKNNEPWNKGLTTETNEKVKLISEKTSETLKQKYSLDELKPWNKGLTKEENSSLQRVSDNHKGENNPVHRIQNKDNWRKNISEALKGKKRGKLENICGEENAKLIKEQMSESAKNRKIHGHTGCKHSEESKQLMRDATIRRIKEGKFPKTDTEPMNKFETILQDLKKEIDFNFEKEYSMKYCSVDFADVKNCIAFEVDGDFWHANPRSYPDGPIYESQRKNKRYEKIKEKYLRRQKWTLIRFWEYDITNDTETVKNRIREIYSEISKNSKCL